MAQENPFRFSTKRTDNTTDFVLYEYRFYNPAMGRWLSRDPIGERGGENLYEFVRNRPNLMIDPKGLYGNPPSGPNGPERQTPCPCICLSVSISPEGSPIATTAPYKTPDDPRITHLTHLRINVPYSIKVIGDPRNCRCKYVDSGRIESLIKGGDDASPQPKDRAFNPPETTRVSCKDDFDYPGVFIGHDKPHGYFDYSITFNWTGTVTCEGSYLPSISASASINGTWSGSYKY
jgi:RHS repeat-associated protein